MQDFSIQVRVYYEDTDAGGIVYHANYLKFCERARTDWLRQTGISQEKLLHDGEGFVIARMQAAFKRSAHLDDLLTVSCVPIKVRHVSVTFLQEIRNQQGQLLFFLFSEIAYVDKNLGTMKAMPQSMIDFIEHSMALQKQENKDAAD